MLSFSAQCYSTTTPTTTPAGVPGTPVIGAPKLSAKSKAPRPVVIAQREDDDEDDLLIENIDKVHQDEDFSEYFLELIPWKYPCFDHENIYVLIVEFFLA